MRPQRLLGALVFAAVACFDAAHAAAPTMFTAGAGEVRDFVAVSTTVGYAATLGGGLWKTSDAGANWTKTSLTAKSVWKISANPASAGARLYAATESGLFRSTDSGGTWTRLTQDPTRAVAVDPNSAAGGPDTVLIGVHGVGILKSIDNGATIMRQSTGLDSTDVLGIVYYPGSSTAAFAVLQCNVEDAPAPLSGNWGGVYRTTNANTATPAWAAFNAGLPLVDSTVPCVNAIAANGTVVVAGIKDYSSNQGGTYRITSSGAASWIASASNPQPFGVEFLGPDLSNTSAFFLGSTQFGPYRSINGGANFAQIFNGGTDPDFTALAYAAGAFASTTWIASINGLGLFRTTAGASPWSLPTSPVLADRVNDLTNHAVGLPNTYYMALKNGGVLKSLDAGASWAQFNAGLGMVYSFPTSNFVRDVEVIAAHPNNGNVVALAMRAFGLYQLSGGTTWAQVSGPPSFVNAVDHKPQSLAITPFGTVYYALFDAGAATPGGLWRATATSFNIGTLSSTGKPIFEADPSLGVAPGSARVRPSPSIPESRVFLMMYDSLPYRSNDGGATWTRIVIPDAGFQRLAFFDIAEKASPTSTLVASSNKGIYRSADGGLNWTRISASGLTQTAFSAVVYTTNNVLWGGDFGGQLWCSSDDGGTWLTVTGGNLDASIRDLKVLNGQVHVLTDGAGFWKKDVVCP